MFTFIFKRNNWKQAKQCTFIGTWSEFDAKYPCAILLFTPAPVED